MTESLAAIRVIFVRMLAFPEVYLKFFQCTVYVLDIFEVSSLFTELVKKPQDTNFKCFFYPKIINVYLIFYQLINAIIAFKWDISLFQGQFLQVILDKYKQDGHMNIMPLLLIPLSSTCIPASKNCSMLRSWILFYWGSDFTFVLIQYS